MREIIFLIAVCVIGLSAISIFTEDDIPIWLKVLCLLIGIFGVIVSWV